MFGAFAFLVPIYLESSALIYEFALKKFGRYLISKDSVSLAILLVPKAVSVATPLVLTLPPDTPESGKVLRPLLNRLSNVSIFD